MDSRIVAGLTMIALGYGGLVLLLPPGWAPWLSPVELVNVLYVIVVAAVASVLGGVRLVVALADRFHATHEVVA